MDPIMFQHLAYIRQQEMLETAARERNGVPVRTREVFWHVGRSLVLVGQRLMEASKPVAAAPMSAQIWSENC